MKPYVSIDLETTGLDPDKCQILEIGAVIEDWTKPPEQLARFHCYVVHDQIKGEPYALSMHAEILRRIAEQGKHPEFLFLKPFQVGRQFAIWLTGHGLNPECVLAGGKNFAGFDRNFLYKLSDYDTPFKGEVRFHHRSIDPCMLYWNPDTDDVPPGSEECLKRAGLDPTVSHTAIEDAISVIEMVRQAAALKRCWTSRDLVQGLLNRMPGQGPQKLGL